MLYEKKNQMKEQDSEHFSNNAFEAYYTGKSDIWTTFLELLLHPEQLKQTYN